MFVTIMKFEIREFFPKCVIRRQQNNFGVVLRILYTSIFFAISILYFPF